MRSERIRDVIRILHEGGAATQQEMVAALRAAGHSVTQATVSRDLREIGATKVRDGERVSYRLPDDVPRSTADLTARGLERSLADFALAVRQAGSLVVVVTAPGHAAAVARAIDLAAPADVVGTVAGDDTIFVATPAPEAAERVARDWNRGRARPPLTSVDPRRERLS